MAAKTAPIERIFREVFHRKMTAEERKILLGKPAKNQHANRTTPKRS